MENYMLLPLLLLMVGDKGVDAFELLNELRGI